MSVSEQFCVRPPYVSGMATPSGAETVGIGPRRIHLAIRGFQGTIAMLVVVGALLGNPGVVLNGVLALLVTFLPAVLRRDYGVTLPAGITLWVTLSVLLHSFGMVYLYEQVPWWDHLTHALSASLIAGVGYATARALDRHSESVHFPREFLFVYVIVFTMSLGVLWEVLEFFVRLIAEHYGFEPILIQYGLEDTMLDLVFDLVGAILFALFGARETSAIVDALTERLPGTD